MTKQYLEAKLIEKEASSPACIAAGEIVIGTLVAIDLEGKPLVCFSQNSTKEALVAISTLGLTQNNVGRQVALLFANGQLDSPVIVGMIHNPLEDVLDSYMQETSLNNDEMQEQLLSDNERIYPRDNIDDFNQKVEIIENNTKLDDVLIDGKKIVIEAETEIVLKCGESSITLTQSGKILIRGKYLLNRSSGVNRIMGGSVQVN